MLLKDGSVSIHHENILNLANEMFEVKNHLSPEIVAVRFCNNHKLNTIYDIIKTLELLHDLCIVNTKVLKIEMFKIKNNMAPTFLNKIFQNRTLPYNLRTNFSSG